MYRLKRKDFPKKSIRKIFNCSVLFFCLYFFVLFSFPLWPAEPDWAFEDAYRDRLAYLHAYLNYDFNALWYNDWEKNYFSGNGFLLSVGSVTTHDLLVNSSLVINQSLGRGWWFRGEGQWLETYHLNNAHKSTYMGLEKEVIFNTSLYMIVNPAYDKEYTDLNMGILIADSTREKYLRLGLVWEDFVYDEKNSFDGISDKTPLSFQWVGRYCLGKIALFSQGRLSSGFDRRFPNRELSPLLTRHGQTYNTFDLKLYYFPSDLSILVFSVHHYLFEEQKVFSDPTLDFDFHNQHDLFSAEYMVRFQEVNRFRLKINYLDQSAASVGYKGHDFERQDIFPGISYERFFSDHMLELQYIFAYVHWKYHKAFSPNTENERGMVDKIKLGWMVTFPQGSRFYISISHELQGGEFGGANLNYILLF